jgi:4-hydroxybenzoate polyprenyltransferase
MHNRIAQLADVPLVIDLDGTLIKVDLLQEAFVQLSVTRPLVALRTLLKLRDGRAAFKAAVAEHPFPDPSTLPVDETVLEVVREARAAGREVYLATAADRRFAEAVAGTIGAFAGIFASDGKTNLKGEAKADRLVAAFGPRGFDYIGNDASDIPVWRVARTAFVCGAPRGLLLRRLTRDLPNTIPLSGRSSRIKPHLLALRPHQWLKNGLVVLPALAAHDFRAGTLLSTVTAVLSFSLGASAVYLVNDIFDLPHDRAHSEKRRRPLAAGLVSLRDTMVLSAIVAALSITLALLLPKTFLVTLIIYFSLSLTYSVYLKRKLMIDVVALAALYGIRVVAGGAATSIQLSHWLLGLCFFIFLSLALVKRTTEMITLAPTELGKIKGRGYRRTDLQTITALTAASGFVAVLVLALYINSPEVTSLYRRPELLWGICVILVYWLGRVCFLTGRGEMRQDPVVFAATDRISLLAGILVVAVFLLAL